MCHRNVDVDSLSLSVSLCCSSEYGRVMILMESNEKSVVEDTVHPPAGTVIPPSSLTPLMQVVHEREVIFGSGLLPAYTCTLERESILVPILVSDYLDDIPFYFLCSRLYFIWHGFFQIRSE